MSYKSTHEGAKIDESIVAIKPGGTTGQLLAKRSDSDYDTEWQDPVIPPGTLPGDFFTFTPTAAADVTNLSIFVDSADNLLKFKDLSGAVHELILGPLDPSGLVYTDTNGRLITQDMTAAAGKVIGVDQAGNAPTFLQTSPNEEIVAWTVFDADVPVQTVDPGLQAFTVPISPLNGYKLSDVMVSCAVAAAGSVTVNILNGTTPLLSAPLTLTDQIWVDIANDPNAIIDPNLTVARGDRLNYQVILSGDAPSGLYITAVLKAF